MAAELQTQRDMAIQAEREKESLVEKFNNYGEQLQHSQMEMVEQIKKQYDAKLRNYSEREQHREGFEQRMREEIEEESRAMNDIKRQYE